MDTSDDTWIPGEVAPLANSDLNRRMARGHLLRKGHVMFAHLVATDTPGIWKTVKACCGE